MPRGHRGERLLHPQRGPLALRLLPHRRVGVPGLLGVRVGDRFERPVLGVRAAGLERHHERLPAGVHDRVRDLEAARVDPVEDLQAHRGTDPRARGPPAGQRRGGRADQRVRAQVLVADTEVDPVRRGLAADPPVGPGLAQREPLAQVRLERRLPGLGRALAVHPRAGRLGVRRPVAAPGDRGQRRVQPFRVLGHERGLPWCRVGHGRCVMRGCHRRSPAGLWPCLVDAARRSVVSLRHYINQARSAFVRAGPGGDGRSFARGGSSKRIVTHRERV